MNPDEPACWSWEIPPLRSLEDEIELRLAAEADKPPGEQFGRFGLELMLGCDDGRGMRFGEFHAGRCAICGADGRHLVLDHCHRTGQVRGQLCRGCNTREGKSAELLLVNYRRRHPAAILGHYEPYTGRDWEDGWYVGDARSGEGPRPATPWPSWGDVE